MELVLIVILMFATPLVVGFCIGVWYQQYEINKRVRK